MKKLYACMAAILMAATTVSAQNPVAPAALQRGDTIAIVSLGSTPKAGVAEDAARALQPWGFHVLIGKNVYACHGMYAGTIEQRLDDFLWALRNPSVKAIISTRGGYGTSLRVAGWKALLAPAVACDEPIKGSKCVIIWWLDQTPLPVFQGIHPSRHLWPPSSSKSPGYQRDCP